MVTPLRVYLTDEEYHALDALQTDPHTPKRVRLRALALQMSHRGMSVMQIARSLDWDDQTVRKAMYRWFEHSLQGLYEAPGRGRKAETAPLVEEVLEQLLEQPRTWSAGQLVQQLVQKHNLHLSESKMRSLLKKKTKYGVEPGM